MSRQIGPIIQRLLSMSPLNKLSEDDQMIVAGQLGGAMQEALRPAPMRLAVASARPCQPCAGTGKVYDPKTAGPELRALRESMNVSLREMARRMRVSPAYVSRAERGEASLSTARVGEYVQKVML